MFRYSLLLGTFGPGSDAHQRRLLQRIALEWLSPRGCLLMDVYSPVRPARDAGIKQRLLPFKEVPGSVEMSNRCDFDSIQCRWIDERVPVLEPQKVLAQAIRCYSPADFLLLLEGTGLIMKHIEVDGQELDAETNTIATSGPLMNAWCYLVQLVFNSKPTSVSQPS